MRGDLEYQRFKLVDLVTVFLEELANALRQQQVLDNITLLILISGQKDLHIQLIQYTLDLHDDELEHRVGVDVLVFSEEGLDPG